MAPGVYTYTVTGAAPCANCDCHGDGFRETQRRTQAPTEASRYVMSAARSASSLSSAARRKRVAHGAARARWSGGQYDPATMTPGVYTYTVTGAAPCANATATVTVTETTAADAGTDGDDHLVQQRGGHGPVCSAWRQPRCRRHVDRSQRRGAQRHLHPGHGCGGCVHVLARSPSPLSGRSVDRNGHGGDGSGCRHQRKHRGM